MYAEVFAGKDDANHSTTNIGIYPPNMHGFKHATSNENTTLAKYSHAHVMHIHTWRKWNFIVLPNGYIGTTHRAWNGRHGKLKPFSLLSSNGAQLKKCASIRL